VRAVTVGILVDLAILALLAAYSGQVPFLTVPFAAGCLALARNVARDDWGHQ
jgi:hypothetical protein